MPGRKRKRLAAAIGLAGVFALPAVAAQAAHLRLDKSYYAISGKSREEIKASVRFRGPKGGSAYGLTTIDFLPRWKTHAEGGTCRVVDVDVGLRIAMRLPRWHSGPDEAAPAAARRFVTSIERHEMGHVAIAKRHAVEMGRLLAKLVSKNGCWPLYRMAEDAIAGVKRRHLGAHRLYDERTRRGIRGLLN